MLFKCLLEKFCSVNIQKTDLGSTDILALCIEVDDLGSKPPLTDASVSYTLKDIISFVVFTMNLYGRFKDFSEYEFANS